MNDTPLEDFGADVPESTPMSAADRAEQRMLDRMMGNQPCDPEQPSVDNTSKMTQWAIRGSGEYQGIQKTQDTLPPGVYRIKVVNGNTIFCKTDVNIDNLMEFSDWIGNSLLKEIEDFWSRSRRFAHFGFLHRRGYLLYGPPGGGKTSLVQQIIKRIIDRNGIVFICDVPDIMADALRIFREIEPDRNIVCIFEDVDALIESYGDDELLSLLDGESQVDKVLNIATTNYPEKLDKRLVGRPRRFDRVVKIGMPNEDVRRSYFTTKLKLDPTTDDVDNWIRETKDFSFAAMAELVISVKCLDTPFNDAVKTLRKLMVTKPADFENDGVSVGFFASS